MLMVKAGNRWMILQLIPLLDKIYIIDSETLITDTIRRTRECEERAATSGRVFREKGR